MLPIPKVSQKATLKILHGHLLYFVSFSGLDRGWSLICKEGSCSISLFILTIQSLVPALFTTNHLSPTLNTILLVSVKPFYYVP